jgi:hypothetical protein
VYYYKVDFGLCHRVPIPCQGPVDAIKMFLSMLQDFIGNSPNALLACLEILERVCIFSDGNKM